MITAILIFIIFLLAFVIDKGIRKNTQVPYRRNNYRRQEEKFLRAKIYTTIFALFLLILFLGTEKTAWVFPVLGFHFAILALLDGIEEKRNIPQERKHSHSFFRSIVSLLIAVITLVSLALF